MTSNYVSRNTPITVRHHGNVRVLCIENLYRKLIRGENTYEVYTPLGWEPILSVNKMIETNSCQSIVLSEHGYLQVSNTHELVKEGGSANIQRSSNFCLDDHVSQGVSFFSFPIDLKSLSQPQKLCLPDWVLNVNEIERRRVFNAVFEKWPSIYKLNVSPASLIHSSRCVHLAQSLGLSVVFHHEKGDVISLELSAFPGSCKNMFDVITTSEQRRSDVYSLITSNGWYMGGVGTMFIKC